jgi:CRP-like cAMP-binding protein
MLLQRTLTELDRTRRWMLLLGRKSASEKVASFLLELSGVWRPKPVSRAMKARPIALSCPSAVNRLPTFWA